MSNLIIVESPTKAKTISKFLDKGHIVTSSYGHVRDLPKTKLGIDVDHSFEPQYVIPAKARAIIKQLKALSKKSDATILATDEDREGEAIAWHLIQALGLKNHESRIMNHESKIQRIVFHEITKHAIDEALKNPRDLDMRMVDAQQARRILDRIVGYKISPFLWKKVARGLSAGRVQSVAVRLIVERENEIRAFKTEEYWTITALLVTSDVHRTSDVQNIEAVLSKINGKALDKLAIKTKDEAEDIVKELKKATYAVASITRKHLKRNPLPPFTTSTLQQEAAKRLGYSAKKTMFIAQQLYEEGHITYMRTDSVNLSRESTAAAKQFLEKEFGERYAAQAPRFFETKSKSAQEAHEAIRPTAPAETLVKAGNDSANKLYNLIWRRFIASQMPQAEISSTTIEISAQSKIPAPDPAQRGRYGAGKNQKSKLYTLKSTGQQILFDGYLKVWPQKLEEKELPDLRENDPLTLTEIRPEQHYTEPPARYSEAGLIKTLEEYGIGRPSTYAPTISVIQTREYVVKEKGRFHPTPTGELVTKILMEHFPEIIDINFTATMENTLDAIAEGTEQWRDVIGAFYQPFIKNLETKYAEVGYQKVVRPAPEKTNEVCEKCGKPMVIRTGRYGRFMACSGFPECKNTKRLDAGFMIQDSKGVSVEMPCPTCAEGKVVLRRTRKGRMFWGCSAYPKCDYATWKNPSMEQK